MFTGLIQSLGEVHPLDQDRFQIKILPATAAAIMDDLALGDSVAVDGVCLTVEEILDQGFVATASPETLEKTTLGDRLGPAKYVNLETSLRVGSKIGGHFVTGHVDGFGALASSENTGRSWALTFTAPQGLEDQWHRFIAPYVVSKGSVAVNGISLTVAQCDRHGQWFTVAVIPHSYGETNLQYLQLGSRVNVEGDILGKYVGRFLQHHQTPRHQEAIGMDFLAEHGYL